jgi:hypothetical protein
MGYESTKAIGLHLRGERPQQQVDSGATLVTASDLDKAETKALLFPDIQQYLNAPKH